MVRVGGSVFWAEGTCAKAQTQAKAKHSEEARAQHSRGGRRLWQTRPKLNGSHGPVSAGE